MALVAGPLVPLEQLARQEAAEAARLEVQGVLNSHAAGHKEKGDKRHRMAYQQLPDARHSSSARL